MFSYWGTFVMQSDAKNSTCFPHAIDICEDCWFMVCPGGKFTVPSVNNKACNLSHHVLEKLGTLLWDTACMNLVARSCMKTNRFFFGGQIHHICDCAIQNPKKSKSVQRSHGCWLDGGPVVTCNVCTKKHKVLKGSWVREWLSISRWLGSSGRDLRNGFTLCLVFRTHFASMRSK